VAFFVDFIAVGFFFYSYSVFFKSLAAEFGGSRLGVSAGLALSNGIGALIAPFLGRALDRHSIKRIMAAGALLVSAGFLALSRIDSIWEFYLVLGTLVALGISSMGGLSSSKLVANWFVKKRGTALGVATMGISLSGMIMPPIATALIDGFGWRGGFVAYGFGTALLVLPVVLLFVVDRPEDVGLLPDGEVRPPSPGPEAPAPVALHTREIARMPDFWLLAVFFGLNFCAMSAILVHMVPYVTDLDIDAYRAATVISLSAGAGVLGKVVFGTLADRLDLRFAPILSTSTQLAGLALLMASSQFGWLCAAGVVFGFGMGGVVPLQGALVGQLFGRESYGKVMGLMRPIMLPLHVSGLPIAGAVYDQTGHYRAAYTLFLLLYAISIVVVLFLQRAPRRRARASALTPSRPAVID
jgi:MFS family permease